MPCPNCFCLSCLALADPPVPSAGLALPPPELMAENRAPTNSEMAYSRDVIRFTKKTVPLIQAMIDDLEERKAELLDLTSIHKAAISPLRTFPPELLARIFVEFVAMAKWCGSSRQPFSPFLLMGICSRWRRIVLNTPRLWTRIFGVPPMIDLWIIRSKELPLDLDLDLVLPYSRPILKALIPHSHRWESIDFSLGPDSPVLAHVKTRLGSLKRLKLYFGNTDNRIVDFCEVAPQLTEIDLTEIYEPVVIKLPWEQLVVCTLDNSGFALYVLQCAKNLRTFHLNMAELVYTPWLSTPRDPHSCHTGLETLVIGWSLADPSINSFFSSITLPSLRTLDIDFDSAWVDDDIDDPPDLVLSDISRFFERSCKHLSTLCLTNIPVSPDDLVACLAFTPSLVSLDIHYGFESGSLEIDLDELLSTLNVHFPGYILPYLCSLSFRGLPTFSEELLDGVIASRRNTNRPSNGGIALLENLTLKCSILPSQPTSQLPQFHRFVPEGLNITYGGDWDVYNSIQAGSSGSLMDVNEIYQIDGSVGT